MKKIIIYAGILVMLATVSVNAQVTIGENKPAEKFSVLEIVSNGGKGMRLPQLTTTERDALAAEIKAISDADKKKLAEGLVIFNKETKCMDFWNSSKWVSLCLGTSIAGQPDISDKYKLSGKTCFDVNQTDGSSTGCGAKENRPNNFADGFVFTYRFITLSAYTGLSFALVGENTSIVSNFSYADETATITFVDTIVKLAKGKDKDHALKLELIARYSDNTGILRQISLPISIQDCSCGCSVKSGDNSWLTFMCYNLGAKETMSIDEQMNYNTGINTLDSTVYGDLYQWGRQADGHQKRTSPRYLTDDISKENSALADADLDPVSGQVPDTHAAYGKFIKQQISPSDWRITQCDTLWKKDVKTFNDPCPAGWRVPTKDEWNNVVNTSYNTWTKYDTTPTHGYTVSPVGGSAPTLFLPAAGQRTYDDGDFSNASLNGLYWSSSYHTILLSYHLSTPGNLNSTYRAAGMSVRCVAE